MLDVTKILAAMLVCATLSGCSQESNQQPEPNSEEYPLDGTLSAVMTIDPTVSILQNGNNPFTLFDENGEVVVQGTFITADEYNNCLSLVESQNGKDGLTIIEQDFHSGIGDYTLYQYDSSLDTSYTDDAGEFIEYDYLAMIANSNYGVMLGGTKDQEAVRKAFESLDIDIVDTSAGVEGKTE